MLASIAESAWACAGCAEIRRECSPARHPVPSSRSRMMPITISSATSAPESIAALARRPSSVPAPPPRAAGHRWRSAECRERATSRCAWVPLPEPGAPSRTIRIVRKVPVRAQSQGQTQRRPGEVMLRARRLPSRSKRTGRRAPALARRSCRSHAAQRLLRPVRRRHRRHQRLGLRGDRDRARARGTSAASTPGATASSAYSPRI